MALLETLTDSFATYDTSKWTSFTTGTATIAVTNGQVVVTPPASTAGSNYGGYDSNTTYNLTGSYGKIYISPLSQSTNGQTYIKLSANGTNYLQWLIQNGTIYAQKVVAGVTTTVNSGTYNATTYAYLAIRHSNGNIFWQYSIDGIVWQNYCYTPTPITITALTVEFAAGTFQSETLPGSALFDNFNVQPTEASTNTVRKIAQNTQVSWKKFSTLGSKTFTIGVSLIGGNDIIGINPGAIGSPGNYKYFDESNYITGMSWERGFNMPTGGLTKAMAQVNLDNTSGRFTPRYMGGNSELYTAQPLRAPFIINAGFNLGTDITIPQFAGLITEQPELSIRDKTYTFRGADYVDYFQNKYLDQQVMFTAQRTDQVLTTVFSSLGMNTAQYDLDTGINIIPFGMFDTGTRYSDVIHQLVEAENGHFYQDESGIFKFENRQHWDSSPYTLVQKLILTGQVIEAQSPNSDHLINVVEVKGKVINKQPRQALFSLSVAVALPKSSDTTIFVNFDDPVLNLESPSFYLANTLSDGSGTDLTSSVTLKSISKFAQAAKIVFSNNSTSDGFMTDMTLYGRVARATSDLYYRSKDDSSVTAYQERPLTIDNPLIQNVSWAQSYAQMILNDFSDVEKLQTIIIRAIPELQMGNLVSWQGRLWRLFDIKTTLDPSAGFIQELTMLQRTLKTYFRIGISTIGSPDLIAP